MVFGFVKPTVDLLLLVGGNDDYVAVNCLPYAEPQLKGGFNSLPVKGRFFHGRNSVALKKLFNMFWFSEAGHDEWLYHRELQEATQISFFPP
jgi:hypothetical protein